MALQVLHFLSKDSGAARRLASRRATWLWTGALALCLVWNYASFLETVPYCHRPYILGWDSNGYFAWARSMAVDGDIDFRDDFGFLARMGGFGPTRDHFAQFLKGNPYTPLGRIANKYGMGMGLLSLPSMYVARYMVHKCETMTALDVSDFAAVYPLAFIFTSILAAFAGLAVSYRVLKTEYGAGTALQSVVCGSLGLSVGFYIWFDPTMAHAASFGCNALFVCVAVRWARAFEGAMSERPTALRAKTLAGAFALGLLLGFSSMVRYTNAAFFLFPVVLIADAWRRRGGKQAARWLSRAALCLAWAAAGTLLGFLPQMVAWKMLYGSFAVYSYTGEAIHWFPVYLGEILFGRVNSLFLWTPLALVACVGLGVGVCRGRGLAFASAAVLLAQLWVYGAWSWYTLESSFGMRGLVDCSFVFFLGLAEILSLFRRPAWRGAARTAIWILVAWNLYFMVAYRARIQPDAKPFAGGALFAQGDRWLAQARRDLTVFGSPKYSLFTLSDPFDGGRRTDVSRNR